MHVVRLGLPRRHELLADEQRKRQIDQLVAVHVSELATAVAKLDAAEPVRSGRHARPGRHLPHDRLLDALVHWNPPPAPGRNAPRGVAGGRSTMLDPRTPIVSPAVSGGACCTASKLTRDDSYS